MHALSYCGGRSALHEPCGVHRIASHRIASHRIASHRTTVGRIGSVEVLERTSYLPVVPIDCSRTKLTLWRHTGTTRRSTCRSRRWHCTKAAAPRSAWAHRTLLRSRPCRFLTIAINPTACVLVCECVRVRVCVPVSVSVSVCVLVYLCVYLCV